GVICRRQDGAELLRSSRKNVNTTGIKPGQFSFSRNQVKRCAFFASGFGQREGAGIKLKSSQGASSVRNHAALLPVQPTGNHEMEDQPQIAVEANDNSFSHTTQGGYGAAMGRFNGRICASQKKRAADYDSLQHVADNALLQRFQINKDVWQFGQD